MTDQPSYCVLIYHGCPKSGSRIALSLLRRQESIFVLWGVDARAKVQDRHCVTLETPCLIYWKCAKISIIMIHMAKKGTRRRPFYIAKRLEPTFEPIIPVLKSNSDHHEPDRFYGKLELVELLWQLECNARRA